MLSRLLCLILALLKTGVTFQLKSPTKLNALGLPLFAVPPRHLDTMGSMLAHRILHPLKKAATMTTALIITLLPRSASVHAKGSASVSAQEVQIIESRSTLLVSTMSSQLQQRPRTSTHDFFGTNNKRDSVGDEMSSGTIASTPAKRKGLIPSSNTFVREAVRSVGPSVVRIDCEREIPQMMSMFAPDNFREGDTMKVR